MKSIVLPLLMILMLSFSSTTQASEQNGKSISQQQAISAAQQAYPGRVLGVKRHHNTYRVKMLNDNGEVRIIVIDANSGQLLKKR